MDTSTRRPWGNGCGRKTATLNSAAEEIQLALERNYFKFVINWDLRLTIEELHEHIASGEFG